MAEEDFSKYSIESLSHFLNKHFPNASKKIRVEKDNVIIEIPDLEISPIYDLFKQAPQNLLSKIDELEGTITFPQKNTSELFNFLHKAYKPPSTPNPTVLHFFTNKQERQSDEIQRVMEYSNVPREKLYTTDHEQTPQFIANATITTFKNCANSLENYIHKELKHPTSHGYLGGLFGSDQVVKKNIAQNILGKLDDFSKLSLSDPDYMQAKQNLMRDLNDAINKNRKAHGFWASLAGPGKLESILISAKEALEPSAKQLNNKNRV